MKVLNIIQCTNLGGMEQASLRLMKALQKTGYRFEVLSLNPLGGLAPMLSEAGVPASGMPYLGRGGWRTFPSLVKRLKRSDHDVLLMTGHHLLGSVASLICGSRKSVLAIHYHHTGVKPAWQWKLIYLIAHYRFNSITFSSHFIREEAERLYPPLRKLAHTIPNPIQVPRSRTSADRDSGRHRLGLAREAIVIGNAGWLIRRKRWDIFLHTAQKVTKAQGNCIFVIAGDGPERADLEALARSLNISEHLRWLGWQEDLSDFYASLDVLLFNSDWDAIGLTPLEAMSHGIPVVASVENGGLREILRTGQDGFLIERHEVDKLAAAVEALISDTELRDAMGAAGRQRIHEMCDPETVAATYDSLLIADSVG